MALSQDEIADEIRDTLLHARMCWEAWWLLEGTHPRRDAIVRVYNRYRNFFGAVHPALFCTAILKVASMFETSEEKLSIRMLPGTQADHAFQSIWERGRRLYGFRSKVVAHTDVRQTAAIFAKQTGFTYDNIRDLIADTCSLFDRCAAILRIEPVSALCCEADFLHMVSDLEKTL